jgi:hypothetical protein
MPRRGHSAAGQGSMSDQETWLRERGWRERPSSNPCRWYKKPLLGSYYRLRDAVDLEMSKKSVSH